MVRVLLADDHDVLRRGLRQLIEEQPGWEVCAEAVDGRQAVALAKEHKPDIAIIDISMPELNGLEATRQIKKALPRIEVLIFTMHEDEQLVRDVLAAGAKGYLLKTDASRHIIAAVDALSRHRPFFTSHISESMLDMARRLNRFEQRCTYHHNAQPDLRLFADSSFTFIYSNITLQHIPPPLAIGYVSEFIRVLRDDGLAVFQLTSHFGSPVLRLRRWLGSNPALHQIYRKVRHGGEPPPASPYSMYAIPSRRVRSLVSASEGRVTALDRDHSAPPEWVSFRYYVRKLP